MTVPNRSYSSPSYRYGFQGQEKDDEIKGSGNSLNYRYRMHDPRLGRFFAVDPLKHEFPWNSPYAFSENRVIDGVELEGLEVRFSEHKDAQRVVRDLNVIYSKTYPKSKVVNFFALDYKVLIVKDKLLNKFDIKNSATWFGKNIYSYKGVVVFDMKTNPYFDWDTDEHTKATFDIINAYKFSKKFNFSVSIKPKFTDVYENSIWKRRLSIGIVKGWSFPDGTRRIWLSESLNKVSEVGSLENIWTFGGTFWHELVQHHHPIGDKIFTNTLGIKYNLPNASINHMGKIKEKGVNWTDALLDKLKELRLKTGTPEEIEKKKQEKEEANDKTKNDG
jgi:RHS repeat-associated protein